MDWAPPRRPTREVSINEGLGDIATWSATRSAILYSQKEGTKYEEIEWIWREPNIWHVRAKNEADGSTAHAAHARIGGGLRCGRHCRKRKMPMMVGRRRMSGKGRETLVDLAYKVQLTQGKKKKKDLKRKIKRWLLPSRERRWEIKSKYGRRKP